MILDDEWKCFHLFQEKRLRDRNTESEESLQKRLKAAEVDLKLSKFVFVCLFFGKNLIT